MAATAPASATDALLEIIQILNKYTWAFTGSFAISLYSKARTLSFRSPNDVDVLISSPDNAEHDIREKYGYYQVKVNSEGGITHLTIPGSGLKLDLIGPSKKFGDLKDVGHLVTSELGKVPVVSLATLASSKENALKTAQGELDDLDPNDESLSAIKQTYEELAAKNAGDLSHLAKLMS